MKKKPLTNVKGEVHELTSGNIRSMRTAKEVLPAGLLKVLPKAKGQRGRHKVPVNELIYFYLTFQWILWFLDLSFDPF